MPVQQCREGTFAVLPVVLQNYELSIKKKKRHMEIMEICLFLNRRQ